MKIHLYVIAVLVTVLGLIACDNNKSAGGALPVPEAPERKYDPQQLATGERVYQAECASCHGAEGQGAENWRKRGPDGLFPAPPLNGSGHSWHHSTEVLTGIIRNGSPDNKRSMPAWEGRLTDQEIEAVVLWFQSRWPQPVYNAWYEMQQRGR
ncbi:c-type cytochrome [Kaarinaea lacus]